jgi:hypothetical protein
MAGINKLQMLAATITPPVNPSMASRKLRFMVLKKNTNEAPNAVTNHVKMEAYNAAKTGFISEKYVTIASIEAVVQYDSTKVISSSRSSLFSTSFRNTFHHETVRVYPATHLRMLFALLTPFLRANTELLLEVSNKMRRGTKAHHAGDLIDLVVAVI